MELDSKRTISTFRICLNKMCECVWVVNSSACLHHIVIVHDLCRGHSNEGMNECLLHNRTIWYARRVDLSTDEPMHTHARKYFNGGLPENYISIDKRTITQQCQPTFVKPMKVYCMKWRKKTQYVLHTKGYFTHASWINRDQNKCFHSFSCFF